MEVSQSTVHNWVEQGLLKSWRTAGGHRRIAQSSLDAILAGRKRALQGAPKNFSILLVEDDPYLTKLYVSKVKKWSFAVDIVIAENGFEGLIQAGVQNPDLIIADLMMPDMNGFKMIDSLRQAEGLQQSRIVVVTSLTAEQIAEQGQLPADVAIFNKPVPFEKLRDIATELRGHQK
uniref:Uncharacterized protein n=1 Tax=Magnetococcus massalia (strain MO-1) TaxID=451514 RepID=A0A1S7LKG8_MAGMO|nr:Protein of unknown function. Containing response regulator receiver domain and MerR family regulatory domain [Candidatus Magnetococcus massalia]